ncbi:MAG: hypothetical protein EP346_01300 [Bacteroidetes bacterium]|nr:MAG: hypothetical protein EP346_01300 [Bacteroidota bacterium]
MSTSHPKTFQVYSASAGAGKTFSLVREYLKICLRSETSSEFTRILAITFTLKAAGEMKRRVLEALNAFRQPTVPSKFRGLYDAVADDLEIDDATLSRRSHEVLKSILHDYTGLSISTIDKFTYRLVRTFSHDLGLASNFDVELDDAEMYRQSIDLLLDDSGRHEELTKLLHRYVDRKMDEGKYWKPEGEMLKMAAHLGDENSAEILDKLESWTLPQFIEVRGKLESQLAAYKAKMHALGEEGMKLIAGIPTSYFNYGAVPSYFKKALQNDLSAFMAGKRIRDFHEKGVFTKAKPAPEAAAAIEPINDALTDLIGRCIAFEDEEVVHALILEKVLANYDGMAVLHEIAAKLNDYKEANNLESLKTFNKLIYESLINLPTPYIYERIGEKYRHYFIDEFQDTSSLQWLNLTPLVHNAVASGGSTMIVGDAKQSIYRWRGGEAEQFLGLIESARNPDELGGDVAYALKHVSLEHNWRSATEIINFNNDFFGRLAEVLGEDQHQQLYREVAQKAMGQEGGMVSIEFLETERKNDLFHAGCLQKTLVRVRECLDAGYHPGDIAILVRNNVYGEKVARVLTQEGINVVSVDSLKLQNSSAVRAIIAFIRLKLNPADLEARMELVDMLHQSGVYSMTAEELHAGLLAASDVRGDAWQKWTADHEIAKALAAKDAAGLFEWGENAARALRLIDGRKPDPFIQFFLDELYAFGQRKSHNIVDFLTWWYEKGQNQSITVPNSREAVQVMSIHKSKGLEFPVVIFPFANFEAKRKGGDTRWVRLDEAQFEGLPVALMGMNSDLAARAETTHPSYTATYERFDRETVFDNINLLYVVLTRPVDRLYIISEQNNSKTGPSMDKGKINDYLLCYLEEKGLLPEGDERLILGTETPAPSQEEDEGASARSIDTFVSNAWRGRVQLSRDTDGIKDQLSDRPRMWGNTIHNLLAEVERASDLPQVLQRAVVSGKLPKSSVGEIREVLEKVVNHPELSDSFTADKVYNERDWVGDHRVHRPDRITSKNGVWTVLDYKTGDELSSHKKQIRQYADLLGVGQSVRSVLVYINDDVRIVEVRSAPSGGEQLTLL